MKFRLICGLFLALFLCSSGNLYSQNQTNSSDEIKKLIAKKREFNAEYGYGFRIQIFYGSETKARSLRNKFRLSFPNVPTNLKYEQPYWKVQVGNYKTRLEADKALLKFSEKFASLIVIPLGK